MNYFSVERLENGTEVNDGVLMPWFTTDRFFLVEGKYQGREGEEAREERREMKEKQEHKTAKNMKGMGSQLKEKGE